jgi:hypothetical protein
MLNIFRTPIKYIPPPTPPTNFKTHSAYPEMHLEDNEWTLRMINYKTGHPVAYITGEEQDSATARAVAIEYLNKYTPRYLHWYARPRTKS